MAKGNKIERGHLSFFIANFIFLKLIKEKNSGIIHNRIMGCCCKKRKKIQDLPIASPHDRKPTCTSYVSVFLTAEVSQEGPCMAKGN